MDWAERQERWRRFSEWEAAYLRDRPPDLAAALDWMWDAWRLAAASDPARTPTSGLGEHVQHIVRIRSGLAHIRGAK